MALIANREARHYTTTIVEHGPKDAHGNTRIVQRRLVLRPGVNDVDDELWRECFKNARVRERVGRGTLEILEEPEPDEPTSSSTPPERMAASLGGLNVRDAKLLIRETIDVDVLEAWAEVDDRKGVLEAIEVQLGKVTRDSDDKPVGRRRNGGD